MSVDLNDALRTAVISRIATRYDDTGKSVTAILANDVAEGELELDAKRVQFIEMLEAKLAKAKDSDGEVTQAYRRLIQKHSSK